MKITRLKYTCSVLNCDRYKMINIKPASIFYAAESHCFTFVHADRHGDHCEREQSGHLASKALYLSISDQLLIRWLVDEIIYEW